MRFDSVFVRLLGPRCGCWTCNRSTRFLAEIKVSVRADWRKEALNRAFTKAQILVRRWFLHVIENEHADGLLGGI